MVRKSCSRVASGWWPTQHLHLKKDNRDGARSRQSAAADVLERGFSLEVLTISHPARVGRVLNPARFWPEPALSEAEGWVFWFSPTTDHQQPTTVSRGAERRRGFRRGRKAAFHVPTLSPSRGAAPFVRATKNFPLVVPQPAGRNNRSPARQSRDSVEKYLRVPQGTALLDFGAHPSALTWASHFGPPGYFSFFRLTIFLAFHLPAAYNGSVRAEPLCLCRFFDKSPAVFRVFWRSCTAM